VKVQAAFKIYDFDDDGYISKADVRAVLSTINNGCDEKELENWKKSPLYLTDEDLTFRSN
jgi:Ca2+-binding EF-hand superfamily protein